MCSGSAFHLLMVSWSCLLSLLVDSGKVLVFYHLVLVSMLGIEELVFGEFWQCCSVSLVLMMLW